MDIGFRERFAEFGEAALEVPKNGGKWEGSSCYKYLVLVNNTLSRFHGPGNLGGSVG